MPQRSCCSCRERKDSSQLMRLFIDPNDTNNHIQVSLIKPSRGRTAWICYQPSCFAQILKRPRIIGRTLRRTPNLSRFKKDVIQYLKRETEKSIKKIYRSGRVFVLKEKPEKNAQYWISYHTTLAKETKIEYLTWEKVLHFQVILGENPPSHLFYTIGIQSGKFSQQLLQELCLLQFLLQEENM